jgi:glycine/D-amino acid oxidase-like deaminating enzyme
MPAIAQLLRTGTAAATAAGALLVLCRSDCDESVFGSRWAVADEAPAVTAVPHVPQVPHFRTVVIGGGIVGASTAYHVALAQTRPAGAAATTTTAVADSAAVPKGCSVALLERGSVGCEASGLSAGTIYSAGWPSGPNAPRVGEHLSSFLTAGTMDILRDLEERGFDCSLRVTGALSLATDKAQAAHLLERCAADRLLGLQVEFVDDAAALRALEPRLGSGVVAATHSPLSGHCALCVLGGRGGMNCELV